jgi:translocation protein SEC62
VLIIGLAIFKYILFGVLFALSAGKLKFWIFPNLTEDVGFVESFLPIYDYTYTGSAKKKKDKVKKCFGGPVTLFLNKNPRIFSLTFYFSF